MDRREALKKVAIILGGTVIGSHTFLGNDRIAQKPTEELSLSDIELLDELAETIIPATDTPGAKAAEVGKFMELMISDCYTEKNKAIFFSGIEKIRKNFKTEFGHSFMRGTSDERLNFLNRLDDESETYTYEKGNDDPEHYFRIMKELVLLGYFTSEIGCKQAHRYIQTPGRYTAIVEYTGGEKSWAVP